jgi:hypothetical protein
MTVGLPFTFSAASRAWMTAAASWPSMVMTFLEAIAVHEGGEVVDPEPISLHGRFP